MLLERCDRNIEAASKRRPPPRKPWTSRATKEMWKEWDRQREKVPTVHPPLRRVKSNPSSLPAEKTTHYVSNLCTFKCPSCKTTAKALNTFRSHLSACVGNVRFSPAQVREARYHRCCICARVLLCDRTLIHEHLKQMHKLDMSAYQAMVDKKRKEGNLNQQENLDKLKASIPTAPLRTLKVQNQKHTVFAVGPKKVHNIEDLCRFACAKCPYKSYKVGSFTAHLKACTGGGRIRGEHILEARHHTCLICDKTVLAEKAKIYRHASRVHKASKETYNLLAEGKLSLEDAPVKLKPDVRLRKAAKSISPVGSSPFVRDASLVPEESLVIEPANACVFSCSECGVQANTWHSMGNHIRKAKHVNGGRGESGPSCLLYDRRYVKEARYHPCKICPMAVLCDRKFIHYHYAARHRISPF